LHNCLEIDSQLSGSDSEYIFYNVSDRSVDRKNWVKSEDVRYYGHFYNGLKDFISGDYSVFIFNAGDPVYDNYPEYTKYIEKLFDEDDKIGLFAPSFDYDTFTGAGSFIVQSQRHKNLYLSTMTNGIYLAMDRDTAKFTLDFMNWLVEDKNLYFPSMKSGWGLDLVYNSHVIYENKKIYRDSAIWHHPRGSSYEESQGKKEIEVIIDLFLEYAQVIELDAEVYAKIISIMVQKAITKGQLELKPSDIYLNALKDLEI
jgi:hypothetical protein